MAAKLSFWMDGSKNHSMEFTTDPIIESKFTKREEEEETPGKNKNLMYHNDQQPQSEYRKLGEIIKNYEEVTPFGFY